MIQLRANTKTVVVICAFAQYNAPEPSVQNREQLPELNQIGPAVSRLQKLFSSERYQSEGIEVVPALQCKSRGELQDKLDEIRNAVQDRPETNLILFWSGHGGLDDGSFRLATPDTYAPIEQEDGLGLDEISRYVGIARVNTWTLFLDACQAGAGFKDVVEAVSRQVMAEARVLRGFGAVYSSAPYERALDSVFLNMVIDVLLKGPSEAAVVFAQGQGRAGAFNPNERVLSAAQVFEAVNAEYQADPVRVRDASLPMSVFSGNFWLFPNPQYRSNQPSRLMEDAYRTIALTSDLKNHFFPKAIGIDTLESGWHFTGRVDATWAILQWMRKTPTTKSDSLYVLVADGGTGKSALLGRLIALTDEVYRKNAKMQGWDEEADRHVGTVPDLDQIDAALSLRNLTASATADHLAGILKISKTDSVEHFVEAARDAYAKADDSPPCIVLDALDEAEDPSTIVYRVIHPLVNAGWKVLVATRPSAQTRGASDLLATLGEATRYRLDQDTQSAQDIHDYVYGRLKQDKALLGVAEPAAGMIADRADNKFLFARMSTSSLLRNAAEVRPENLEHFIANNAGEILEKEVAELNTAFQQKFERGDEGATAMLTALSWAQGEGMPMRDDIWAAMAMAMAEISQIAKPKANFDDRHLQWLLREAGRYIQEAGDGEQAIYRLFHQSLVEHFQKRRTSEQKTQRVQEERLAQALVKRVRASRGWHYANAYLVRHMPAHLAMRPSQKGLNNLLLNFDWVQARLNQSGIEALLNDYNYCDHASPATARLQRTLSMAAHILRKHPAQLIPQMLGRIAPGVPDMRPLLDGQPGANFSLPPFAQEILSETEQLMLQAPQLDIEQAGPSFIDRTLQLDGFLERARAMIQGSIYVPELGGLAQAGALVRIMEGHKGDVYSVAVSPDGKTIVSGSWDHTVRMWDAQTGAPLRTLQGHEDRVSSVAVSPDGKTIVSGSWDKTVRVWDAQTGAPLRTLQGHEDRVSSVAVSPDGKTIVSGSASHTVRMWDALPGVSLRTLHSHKDQVSSVAVSPDGKTIVSGSEDHTVRVWDALTGAPLRTLHGHKGAVRSVAMSPDGKTIVSGSEDHTVRVWDAQTGAPLRTLQGHEDRVSSVAVSPDGKTIVSGSWDNTVQMWDVQTGTPLRTLQAHKDPVNSMAVSPDSKTIISGSWDATVRVWDALTGAPLRMLQGHEGAVNSVAVSPDGKTIVSGSGDATVRVWNVQTGAPLRTLQGHEKMVSSVVVSLDGKAIVSGSWDKTVRVWDAQTGALLRTLQVHETWVNSVAVSPDGKTIVSGGESATVRVWDTQTGAPLRTLQGHEGEVNSVAVSPDGKTIVSGSEDHTVRVWDAQTGTPLRTLQGHEGGVSSVAVSPDGKTIISGSWDKTVRVWDAQTGTPLRTLQRHEGAVNIVAVSQDGKTIVSGSRDATVRVWDALPEAPLRTLHGHKEQVSSVAVSQDGKTIVSGSWDKTVRVWDAQTGAPLRTLQGHETWVSSVAVSPDGKTIVSGGYKTVRLWDALTGAPLRMLQGHEGAVRSVAMSPDGKTIVSGGYKTVRVWDALTGAKLERLDLDATALGVAFAEIDGSPALVVAARKSLVRLIKRSGAPVTVASPPPPNR